MLEFFNPLNMVRDLKRSNRLLYRTFESLHESVIILDAKSREIIECNGATEELFEYSKDELIGSTTRILHLDEHHFQSFHELTIDELERTGSAHIEFKLQKKNGEVLDTDHTVTFVYDDSGDATQVVSVVRDITEQKQYTNRLKNERNRLKEAQRVGKIGDWDYDVESGEIFWSEQIYKIYGRDTKKGPPTYEELLGYYVDNGEFLDKNIQKSISQGEGYEFDLEILTEKGERKYIYHQGKTDLDEESNTVKLHGIVQDITERKEKELEVLRREQLLSAITNNVDAVVFRYVLNPDGSDEMRYVSKSIERLYEIDAETIMNSTHRVWDLVVDEDVEPLSHSIQMSAKTLENWEHRFRVRLPSGKLKWIQGHGHPNKLEDGSVQWDTMIMDITDQVQQQQINETLIQEVHHRVKNNLAIITGFLELQLLDLEEDRRERLPLERAVTRIYSIAEVHKLLYEGSDLVSIDVRKYLEELIDLVTNTIKFGDEFEVDLQFGSLQMNVNELTPLGILINELITNSLKYAFDKEKQGRITIKISKDDSTYQVTYKDNGPGIESSTFEKAQTSGFNIVKILLNQLGAEHRFLNENGFTLKFTFKERRKGAHGNLGVNT